MDSRDFVLKSIRKCYRILTNKKFPTDGDTKLDRQDANDQVYALLTSPAPCMVARFGTTEMGILTNYLSTHSNKSFWKLCFDFITDNSGMPWWDKLYTEKCEWASGIFPPTIDTLEKLSQRYLADIPEIDLLGSFNYNEKYMPLSKEVQKVHLECLYPFFVKRPWTRALRGKKVLVIHPFTESIELQHKRKELLFEDNDIWPDYELITLKAIQSGGGAKCEFESWFKALKYMENEIDKIDFDIAIIGCGAYGLPLAAHIKRLGKKALHIAGGTQLLFGIKGARWEGNYRYKHLPVTFDTDYKKLFNEFWIRPNAQERPHNAEIVENACYW